MKKLLLVTLVAVLYALHQDVWNWQAARPLIFGFVPIGLFYHASYSVASSVLFVLLVKTAWPRRLEDEVRRAAGGRSAEAAD
jgi:hypothetical protein